MKKSPAKVNTEQIWRDLSDRLRQFIQKRVASAADGDDILQNVFLRIHQNLGDLHQVERLESWVFQITRNAVADHYRRRRDLQNDGSTLPAADTDQQSDNQNATVASCLVNLIDQLPADQRRAVALFELEGVPQKEIAVRESISLSGVKSRIQRGRQNLESMLRDCCQFQFDRRGNILQCETLAEKNCGEHDCGCAAECN